MTDVVDLIIAIEEGKTPDLGEAIVELESHLTGERELHVTHAQYDRLKNFGLDQQRFLLTEPIRALVEIKVVITDGV